jgi:Protein  of unknown function (DUF3018)
MNRKGKRPAAQMRAKTATRKTKSKAPRAAKLTRASTSRDKVRAYRKRMRGKGLRPVQIWLPDTRTPEFAAEAHCASLAVANSPTEQEDQAFIDSIQWLTSEEEAELRRTEPKRWWKEPSD